MFINKKIIFLSVLLLATQSLFAQWGEYDTLTEFRDNAGAWGTGVKSGFYQTLSPVNFPVGASSWWHLLDVRQSSNVNNYAMQFAGSFFDQQLWFRKTSDNASQPWSRVLMENADGKVGIGTTNPLSKLHSVSLGNTGLPAALIHGQYYGLYTSTQTTSPNYYVFIVESGSDQNGLGGIPRFIVRADGNVGIGTNDTKGYKFAVGGGDIKSYNYDNNTGISIGAENTERPRIGFHVSDNHRRFKIEFNGVNSASERLGIFTANGGAWPETEVFSITKTGNVWIRTIDPMGYRLAVNGDAIFTKVKVKQYPWADYVFEPDYKLPSLKDVEAFIKQYKHLPDVPSAKEVEKNGLEVGESQAVLLNKIEEQMLYIIDLNKRVEQLEKEILI